MWRHAGLRRELGDDGDRVRNELKFRRLHLRPPHLQPNSLRPFSGCRIRRRTALGCRPETCTLCQQPEHSISGLEPAVVAAIPTMKYNRETFHSREDAQCTICLGEYQEREILRIMPTCGHNHHLSCIDIWLQKQSTCPICRLSLNDSIEAKEVAFQAVNRREVSNDHTNQWVLPSYQLLGGGRNNQGSQESSSVVVGFAYGEEP